jgi:choline dehydrogenase-like flavoprotein
MFINYKEKELPSNRYDVCIVGSGPAGLAIAYALLNSNLHVLVVESGDEKITRRSKVLNTYFNSGIAYSNIYSQRARAFGGTTHLWGGNNIPFSEIDFSLIPGRNEYAWPIPYDEYKRYLESASKFLDIDPTQFGQKLSAEVESQYSFNKVNWLFSPFPFRLSERYKHLFEKSSNIDVLVNATLTDINISDACRIASIKIRNFKKAVEIIAQEYVLAAGGIETPRILLNQIERGNISHDIFGPALGAYFAEHPNATVATIKGKDTEKVLRNHSIAYVGNREVKPGLVPSNRILLNSEMLNGIFSIWPIPKSFSLINTAKTLKSLIVRREFNLIFMIKTLFILPGIIALLPFAWYRLQGKRTDFKYKNGELELRLMAETLPNASNKVTLSNKADYLGQYYANLNWDLTSRDKTSFARLCLSVKTYLESQYNVTVTLQKWVLDSDSPWDGKINTDGHFGHHMGTTRMGITKEKSVVDTNCKVHEVDNLYIAGAAVFPVYGFANPTLSICALSFRLAEHLFNKVKR